MRQYFLLLSVPLLLAACSSAAEYPAGIKTNAVMGRTQSRTAFPVDKKTAETPVKGEGLIRTKPAKDGDNSICVGAWCSCDTQ